MSLLRRVPAEADGHFPFLYEVNFTEFAERLTDAAPQVPLSRFVDMQAALEKARLILGSSGVNNLWITGEGGIGKTALVESLLRARALGQLTSQLMTKPHFLFDVNDFFACGRTGCTKRFEDGLAYVNGRSGLLVIDHFDDFVQTAGGDSELLVNGLIASLDHNVDFRAIIISEPKAIAPIQDASTGVLRRFQRLALTREVSFETLKAILFTHFTRLEKIHQVNFTERAADEIIRLLARYPGRAFLGARPNNAIHFADIVGTSVRLRKYAAPPEIAAMQDRIGALRDQVDILHGDGPTVEERRATLQAELAALTPQHDRAFAQWRTAFAPILKAQQTLEDIERRLAALQRAERSATEHRTFDMLQKALPTARAAVAREEAALYPEPPPVTEQHVRAVFSMESGIDLTTLSEDKIKRLERLPAYLDGEIFLQAQAKDVMARMYGERERGLNDPSRPAGVILFTGGTGLGKTELVRVLARFDGGENAQPIIIRLSEFKGKAAVAKLTGADPGLIGHDDEVQLAKVHQNPRAILLFDELDKADPSVFDVMMQILEDGKLTLSKNGQEIDFKDVIIFLATNALKADALTPEEYTQQEVIRQHLLKTRSKDTGELLFREEFLGRCDALVVFENLGIPEAALILQKEVRKTNRDYEPRGVAVTLDAETARALAERYYVPSMGGRSPRVIAKEHIRPLLTRHLDTRARAGRGDEPVDRLRVQFDGTQVTVVPAIGDQS